MKSDFPLLPCTHSLVHNDMLKVHVFDYQVETNDGRVIPAIGYKTEGFMSTFGQKEMILILVVGGNNDYDDDNDESWVPPSLLSFSTSILGIDKKKKKKKRRKFSYEEPLHFFRQLFGITSQSTVEHGSCTKFVGNGGLYGSSAILYSEISSTAPISAAAAAASAVGGRTSSRRDLLNDEDNNLAYYSSYDEDCLAMILLYGEEERSALTTFGHLRLMGLLGHKQGYYPYPYWSELQRPSLFENCISNKSNAGKNSSSALSFCSALGMFTGRIFLPSTSAFTHYPKQKRLVLKMKKKTGTLNGTNIRRDSNTNDGSFFDDTHELPRSENPTILLPGSIEENADGCYVRTIPERGFRSNKQIVKKKKKKKTTIITGSPTRTPSLLSSRSSLSSSYDELLDDDNRINNNATLSTQHHDYLYYYHDDNMISHDKNMACCFLALVGHSDKNMTTNHYRMMEDGFFVYLTDTTWNEFWNHLMRNHNQNYQIQLTEGMVLALEWFS